MKCAEKMAPSPPSSAGRANGGGGKKSSSLPRSLLHRHPALVACASIFLALSASLHSRLAETVSTTYATSTLGGAVASSTGAGPPAADFSVRGGGGDNVRREEADEKDRKGKRRQQRRKGGGEERQPEQKNREVRPTSSQKEEQRQQQLRKRWRRKQRKRSTDSGDNATSIGLRSTPDRNERGDGGGGGDNNPSVEETDREKQQPREALQKNISDGDKRDDADNGEDEKKKVHGRRKKRNRKVDDRKKKIDKMITDRLKKPKKGKKKDKKVRRQIVGTHWKRSEEPALQSQSRRPEHFWERADKCFAVDHVCRHRETVAVPSVVTARNIGRRKGKKEASGNDDDATEGAVPTIVNEWFYYVPASNRGDADDGDGNGGPSPLLPFQPTMELKPMSYRTQPGRVEELRNSIKIDAARVVRLGESPGYEYYRRPPFPVPPFLAARWNGTVVGGDGVRRTTASTTTTTCRSSSSTAKTVVVLQSAFNDMMGEFYARTLRPIDRLMRWNRKEREMKRRTQKAAESGRAEEGGEGEEDSDYEDADEEGVQFYVHLAYKGKTLLDGHHLMLDGIGKGIGGGGGAANHTARATWGSVLDFLGYGDEGERKGEGEGEHSPSSCECYEHLVFCGYDTYYMPISSNHSAASPLPPTGTTPPGLDPDPDPSAGAEMSDGSRDVRETRNENVTLARSYALWPAGFLHNDKKVDPSCTRKAKAIKAEPRKCREWANLRDDAAANLNRAYPTLGRDVAEYRRAMLRRKGYYSSSNDGEVSEWTFIGLTQRTYRRSWINLNDTMAECERRFPPPSSSSSRSSNNETSLTAKVVCVEINVESMRSPHEQLVAHRSLDALMGVHGAQLTQAVFLPPFAHVLEILPWIPLYTSGAWTKTTEIPTPLGIIYLNTDLNHAGYALDRQSVPLCEGVGMHGGDNGGKKYFNATEEKICFLSRANKKTFLWGTRDFTVDPNVVSDYVEKFMLPQRRHRQREVRVRGEYNHPPCKDLRRNAGGTYILYNVWCRPDDYGDGVTEPSVHHYYRNKDESVGGSDDDDVDGDGDNSGGEEEGEESDSELEEREKGGGAGNGEAEEDEDDDKL